MYQRVERAVMRVNETYADDGEHAPPGYIIYINKS